ncbi:MAG: ATP-binding protein [Sulfuricurvum sp.]
MKRHKEVETIRSYIYGLKRKVRETSLRNIILFWFLLLAIFPFLGIALYAYTKTVENVVLFQSNELSNTAKLNVSTLTNRFNESVKNLASWSHLELPIANFLAIQSAFLNNQTSLGDFVHSPQYAALISTQSKTLVNLAAEYDYVYDLFLIDMGGNILYTVKKESDLGTNLKRGPYANSGFAQAFRETVEDKKAHYSDIEYYEPSGGALAGFITYPLFDTSGKMIGIMAVQLKMSVLFGSIGTNSQYIRHYLVGVDGLLRTPLHNSKEVLYRKIGTKVFWDWHKEHGLFEKHSDNMSEAASFYMGPDGKKVLTEHHTVRLLGVRYAHISEIDESEVMRVPTTMGTALLILSLMIIGLVVLAAIKITRRIVKPIEQLSDASNQYMRGIKGVQVKLRDLNEIGKFGEVFNTLIKVQEENEARLESITAEANKTLEELREQKFALDAHSIVAITDVKGKITFVNSKFEEISGYAASELIGNNHRLLNSGFHGKEFWKEMYSTISHGGVWRNEVCNVTKNGSIYWVDTTVISFKNDKGKPQSYVVIRTDITQRKKIEAELIHAKESAEASEHSKSEFLAIMSHEIRTPMNGVLGMLGLLERSQLDKIQHHQLQIAKNSATSLLVLINDILDFSKIEAGKMELEAVEINLHDLLQDLQESFLFKAQEKGLELIIDDSLIEQHNIITDSGRLRQILTNLIGNALKFTHHGKITVKASLEMQGEVGQLHIDVVDSGIGISPEKIATLLDPFTQADGSTTRKYGGTGLGLSIVKRLCELMGGKIYITSTLGEGSIFHAEIVVGLGGEGITLKPDPVEIFTDEVEIQWPVRTRILLVEDNPTNQIVAVGMLDAIGLSADIATNGIEAIEALLLALNTFPYTLVLMDGQMPEMDGYEATRRIRAGEAGDENCTVTIIAMTANAMAGDREKCINVGMNDFITKPVDLTILTKTLMHWLIPDCSEENVVNQDSSIPMQTEGEPQVLEAESKWQTLWNHKEALLRMGGNEGLLDKIVKSFMSDAPQMLASLKEAIEHGNFSDAQLHAHSLKGSSANIGADTLQSISKSIEEAAKAENGTLVQESILICEQILEETLDLLNAHALEPRVTTIKLRSIDPLEMAVALQELQHTIEQGVFVDTDTSIIFSEYADSNITVLMKELKENIEKFEYDKALEAIKRVMEALE